jgi:serine/threonine-protein kinase OSR1/STK39
VLLGEQTCALKRVDLEKHRSMCQLQAEVLLLANLSHPNICSMHTAFAMRDELWFVMPLYASGSCADILRWRRAQSSVSSVAGSTDGSRVGGGLDEPATLVVLREVLRGLQYLHGCGTLHRNLKASNILVDSCGAVRLTDFRASSSLIQAGEQRACAATFVGSPCWMAPEVLEQACGYQASADLWSLGITALELYTGEPPLARLQPMQVMLSVLHGALAARGGGPAAPRRPPGPARLCLARPASSSGHCWPARRGVSGMRLPWRGGRWPP